MTQGAPAALQGADRFHLLKNLAEVLERFCATQSAALKAVDRAHHQALGKALVAPSAPPTAQPQLAQQRRARRLANYEPVQQLRQQGYQALELAHHLSMGERTVFTDLAAPSFPEWQPYPQRRSRHSILTPYKPYLLEQGNAGQHQTKQLFEDIQQQGYQGTDKTVAQYIHQRRQDQRQPLNTFPTPALRRVLAIPVDRMLQPFPELYRCRETKGFLSAFSIQTATGLPVRFVGFPNNFALKAHQLAD